MQKSFTTCIIGLYEWWIIDVLTQNVSFQCLFALKGKCRGNTPGQGHYQSEGLGQVIANYWPKSSNFQRPITPPKRCWKNLENALENKRSPSWRNFFKSELTAKVMRIYDFRTWLPNALGIFFLVGFYQYVW
jgi:hypothetical protein